MQPTAPAIDTPKQSPEQRLADAHARLDGPVLNGSNTAVRELRAHALARFQSLGLPRKLEAWKYTNIARTLRHPYEVATAEATLSTADFDRLRLPALDAYRVVLVNGQIAPALSDLDGLPEGVTVGSLKQALDTQSADTAPYFAEIAAFDDDALAALNTAFVRDGLFVHVPKKTRLDRPVLLVHVLTGDRDLLVQPRVLMVVEDQAEATLVEAYRSLTDAKTFTNQVTEIEVKRGAHADHYLLQDAGSAASSVIRIGVQQEADSVFDTTCFTFSGEVVRNTLHIIQRGDNGASHLNGLFLTSGAMHVDNQTRMDHAAPHSESNELYKGILDGASTGVFNGKVYVHPGAQQINAYQSNKTILLSDKAKMNAKPELEIYADDVKCSHGATTGQLDADALFYLRARGITPERARALMLLAFAHDVLNTVRLDPLRTWLDEQVTDRFSS